MQSKDQQFYSFSEILLTNFSDHTLENECNDRQQILYWLTLFSTNQWITRVTVHMYIDSAEFLLVSAILSTK